MGSPWPTSFTAADAKVRAVALYQASNAPVPTHRTLANPTREGVPLVMLVRKRFGADWLQVQKQPPQRRRRSVALKAKGTQPSLLNLSTR